MRSARPGGTARATGTVAGMPRHANYSFAVGTRLILTAARRSTPAPNTVVSDAVDSPGTSCFGAAHPHAASDRIPSHRKVRDLSPRARSAADVRLERCTSLHVNGGRRR